MRAQLPTYTVVGDDGVVHTGLNYRTAMIIRATYGGELTAET